MAKTTTTSHGRTYTEHRDLDTIEKGTEGPYEYWEGDHTALVHVLWSAKHDGLIAERPSHELPLDRAIFDRMFGDISDRTRLKRADLIADLRAILDQFDPEVTDGAPGAKRLDRDEVDEDKRHESSGIDTTASMIMRSRWYAADQHQAIERDRKKQAETAAQQMEQGARA